MKDKDRIKELERQVALLEARIVALEYRPISPSITPPIGYPPPPPWSSPNVCGASS